MSENPTVVVPCPRCGQMGSGNFCNYCGANLHQNPEKNKDPFIAFASGFLNLKNLRRYFQLYFRLLAAPVANITRHSNFPDHHCICGQFQIITYRWTISIYLPLLINLCFLSSYRHLFFKPKCKHQRNNYCK